MRIIHIIGIIFLTLAIAACRPDLEPIPVHLDINSEQVPIVAAEAAKDAGKSVHAAKDALDAFKLRSEDEVNHYKELIELIPNLQDVLTMARSAKTDLAAAATAAHKHKDVHDILDTVRNLFNESEKEIKEAEKSKSINTIREHLETAIGKIGAGLELLQDALDKL